MMQEISDQSSRTVLLNTFVVKKKRCRVYFHRGTLIWETEKPPYSKYIYYLDLYLYIIEIVIDNILKRIAIYYLYIKYSNSRENFMDIRNFLKVKTSRKILFNFNSYVLCQKVRDTVRETWTKYFRFVRMDHTYV